MNTDEVIIIPTSIQEQLLEETYRRIEHHLHAEGTPIDMRVHREYAGVCGEYATCRVLGRRYRPPDTGAVDIPPNVQVRTTNYRTGRLIVKATDDLACRFVLVTRVTNTEDDDEDDADPYGAGLELEAWRVRGWLPGLDCQRPEWYRPRLHQWTVPQKHLLPMNALRNALDAMPIAPPFRNATDGRTDGRTNVVVT